MQGRDTALTLRSWNGSTHKCNCSQNLLACFVQADWRAVSSAWERLNHMFATFRWLCIPPVRRRCTERFHAQSQWTSHTSKGIPCTCLMLNHERMITTPAWICVDDASGMLQGLCRSIPSIIRWSLQSISTNMDAPLHLRAGCQSGWYIAPLIRSKQTEMCWCLEQSHVQENRPSPPPPYLVTCGPEKTLSTPIESSWAAGSDPKYKVSRFVDRQSRLSSNQACLQHRAWRWFVKLWTLSLWGLQMM